MKQPRPDAEIFLSWRPKRQICRKKEKSDATAENGDGHRDHQGSEFTARPQDERSHPEQQVDGHIEKRHRWNEGDGELRRKMNRDTKGAPRGECIHPAIDQHEPKRVYEGQQPCITKMPPATPGTVWLSPSPWAWRFLRLREKTPIHFLV